MERGILLKEKLDLGVSHQGHGFPALSADEKKVVQVFMKSYLACVEAATSGEPEVQSVARRVYDSLMEAPLKEKHEFEEYVLELCHKCISQACDDQACMLCKTSPSRRCGDSFMHDKYFEDGKLLSKCDQPLRVVLKKRTTGDLVKLDGELVIMAVNGQEYDKMFQGVSPFCNQDFGACMTLTDKKDQPLLYCSPSSQTRLESDGVHILMKDGVAMFPADLRTSTSSQALFSGKSSCYRLVTRVVPGTGQLPSPSQTIASISPSFATLTQRAKSNQKNPKPFLTDCISKLDKMGERRHDKLIYLSEHIENPDLPKKVTTVKDFLAAARTINGNSDLKQQILRLLSISEEDWRSMCNHADQAIEYDTRMRTWKPVNGAGRLGMLIYNCSVGQVDFCKGPIGILYGKEVILKKEWTSAQINATMKQDKVAREFWWEANHPGWSILPITSDEFEENPAFAAEDLMPLDSLSQSLSCMEIDDIISMVNPDSWPTQSPFEQGPCQEFMLAPSPADNTFCDTWAEPNDSPTLKAVVSPQGLSETPHFSPWPNALENTENHEQMVGIEWFPSQRPSEGMIAHRESLNELGFRFIHPQSYSLFDEEPNNVWHSTHSSDLEAQLALYNADALYQY